MQSSINEALQVIENVNYRELAVHGPLWRTPVSRSDSQVSVFRHVLAR
jgi:hypothetical protein